jgi:NAD(P)-dependent dehydrogenase (short-subunit alcohol dehydrogenase family)
MNLSESIVVLTGATDGIGLETARLLVPRGRHLVLHGPQPDEDVRPLTSDLRRSMGQGSTLTYLRADYDELAQVRLAARMADTAERFDILINNAGGAGPPRRTLSIDGNETTLQTNYLAPFLLTRSSALCMKAGLFAVLATMSRRHSCSTLTPASARPDRWPRPRWARTEALPTRSGVCSERVLRARSGSLRFQAGSS